LTNRISKTQIDQLGGRLRKGQVTESDLRQLDDYRLTFGEAYRSVVLKIKNKLGLEPSGRPSKSTSSIIEKLQRETIRLTQVQDIAGCRVIVTNINEQERLVAALRGLFPTAAIVDRRAAPSYGYRAVHAIVEESGMTVEVQIRTTLQHLWAELSEKFSDVMDPAIKYGGGESEVRELLLERSDLVSRLERLEQEMLAPGKLVPEEHRTELEDLKVDMAKSLADLKSMVGRFSRRQR
jgi:putative GTP pyrophosphokinase